VFLGELNTGNSERVQNFGRGIVGRPGYAVAGSLRVRFPIGSLGFFIDLILLDAIWSWGRLNR
jgi:hypothetical protein